MSLFLRIFNHWMRTWVAGNLSPITGPKHCQKYVKFNSMVEQSHFYDCGPTTDAG